MTREASKPTCVPQLTAVVVAWVMYGLGFVLGVIVALEWLA